MEHWNIAWNVKWRGTGVWNGALEYSMECEMEELGMEKHWNVEWITTKNSEGHHHSKVCGL